MYVLDTNIVIRLLNGNPVVRRRLAHLASDQIGIPLIVLKKAPLWSVEDWLAAD